MAAALSMVVTGCGWKPDRAAVISFPVGGTTLYLKRQDWGLNGLAVVLSPTSDWRRIPGPNDYVWCCISPPIPVFRDQDGVLHMWETGANSWRAPQSGVFPVRVEFHVVDALTHKAMHEQASSRGLLTVGIWDWPLKEPPITAVHLEVLARLKVQGVE